MSRFDRIAAAAAVAKSLTLILCAALVAAGAAGCSGDPPHGRPCSTADDCAAGEACVADPGVCQPICGNSAPNPESDLACDTGDACLTTTIPYAGNGYAIARLCFNSCEAGACEAGRPTIAADGTCACVADPLSLYRGGF